MSESWRTKEEDALMSQIANHREAIVALNEKLREAQMKRSGVEIGEIVQYQGQEYKVCAVDASRKKAWVKGRGKKKDGTFGSRVSNLFGDWEKKHE